MGNTFLAHQIQTSEILPWDRNSYLTQAVMRELFIGCIVTHAHGRQVSSMFRQSDDIE